MKFGTASTLWFLAALAVGRANAENYSPPGGSLDQCTDSEWTTSLISVSSAGDDWVYKYEIGSGTRNKKLKEWSISFPEECGVQESGDCEHKGNGFKDDENKCAVSNGFPMVRRCRTGDWDKRKDRDVITIYVPKANVQETLGGGAKVHLYEDKGAKDDHCPQCNIMGPKCGPPTPPEQTTNTQDADEDETGVSKTLTGGQPVTIELYRASKTTFPVLAEARMSVGSFCGEFCVDVDLTTECDFIKYQSDGEHFVKFDGKKMADAGSEGFEFKMIGDVIKGWHVCFAVPTDVSSSYDVKIHTLAHEMKQGEVQTAGSPGQSIPLHVSCAGGSSTTTTTTTTDEDPCAKDPEPPCNDFAVCDTIMENENGAGRDYYTIYDSTGKSMCIRGRDAKALLESNQGYQCTPPAGTEVDEDEPVVECAHDPEPPCDSKEVCDRIGQRTYFMVWSETGKEACVAGRDAKHLVETQGYSCVEVVPEDPPEEPTPTRPNGGYPVGQDDDDVCERCSKKPKFLVFEYTGIDDIFYHHQVNDRASVTGSCGGPDTVTIHAYKEGDNSQTLFSGSVSKGGKFTLERPGSNDINQEVEIIIKGPDNAVLQTIKFNAKCDSDAALVQGDKFGSIELVSSKDENNCGFGELPPAENGGLMWVEEGKVDMCGKATGACDEKPMALKFKYTGTDESRHHQPTKASIQGTVNDATTVEVRVSYESTEIYAGMLAINGTFVVTRSGNDKIDKLLTVQIKSTVGDILQTIQVDSKCEEPLVENDKFGSIQLVAYVDKNSCGFGEANTLIGDNNDYDPSNVLQGVGLGKNMCELCPKAPNKLQFVFVGRDQTSHNQGSLASVAGDIGGHELVRVRAFKQGDEQDADKHWFSGTVSRGEKFTVVGNGKYFPDKNMVIQLVEFEGDTVYQTIQMYTQCDEPDTKFIIGDQFGSIKLVGYEDQNNCGFGDFVDIETKSLNIGVDKCSECGKPMKLKFMYTAEDISNHNQGEEKAFVNGAVNAAPQVQIMVGNAANGIWYAGTHFANETFVVDSHYSEFTHKNMIIQVKDTAGTVLQTVQINVKCEAPIVEGDRFGSIKIIGYVDDTGACGFGDTVAVPSASASVTLNQGNDICTQCGKPMKYMKFQYTGDYVVNHNQGLTKAFVLGTVSGLSSIHLTVSDDKGDTWYRGDHVVGDTIALDAGADNFPSKNMILRLSDPADSTFEPLQTLAIHTSCEAPLVENDEFGSIKLTGSRDKDMCGFGDFPPDTIVIKKETSMRSGKKNTKTKNDKLADTKGEVVFDLEDFMAGDAPYNLDKCVSVMALRREMTMEGYLVPGTAMICDSSNPTGNCFPYEYPQSLGNLLIISKDDNFDDPQCNENGGRFIINFCRPVDVLGIVRVTNDPTEFSAELTDGTFATEQFGGCGVDLWRATELSFSGVTQLNVTLGGCGAITDLKVTPTKGSKKDTETKKGNKYDITMSTGNVMEDAEYCVNWRDCNQGRCMEDNWFRYRNGGHLVCTAKEVKLTHIEAPRMSCEEGEMVTIDSIKGTVHFNTGRYDVGWYIAKDGGDALNGDCYIQPLLERDMELSHYIYAEPGSKTKVGEISWDMDHKKPNDMCGDVHFHKGGGGVLDQTNIGKDLTLPCIDKTQTGYMDVAICFSWREPGGDDACKPKELYPGAPSKCFCKRYDIPQITVHKPDGPVECE